MSLELESPEAGASAAPEVFVPWLCALSLGIDLANGAPDGTALRGTLIAAVSAERAGLSAEDRAAATFGALFRYLGCTSYALEEDRALGDEHEAARLLAPFDAADRSGIARAVVTKLGRGEGALARTKRVARLIIDGKDFQRGYEASHCEGAVLLASRLGVRAAVREVLATLHERWDGTGGPAGLRGEALSPATRVVHLAREAAVQLATGSTVEVLLCLTKRAGGQLDPSLCGLLAGDAAFLDSLQSTSVWTEVEKHLLESLPLAFDRVPSLDEIACVFGDFADVKCPIFLGHSREVADLCVAAGANMGFSASTLVNLRRAGWLHDIGRVAVPNHVWQKLGAFDPIEWERVRLHAYHGERVCMRLDKAVALLVGQHHERGDGSGYARGTAPTLEASLLAAADCYVALGEDRPHRKGYDDVGRCRVLEQEAAKGRLRPEAVRAILATKGVKPSSHKELPMGLTDRERAVLRLVARGLSNKEVAESLGISPRTVQAHTINAYDKLGIRTRAGAALRASELGLL